MFHYYYFSVISLVDHLDAISVKESIKHWHNQFGINLEKRQEKCTVLNCLVKSIVSLRSQREIPAGWVNVTLLRERKTMLQFQKCYNIFSARSGDKLWQIDLQSKLSDPAGNRPS